MAKEAIRLVLHQNSANYREPESYENRRTYPLPPFSTVIGAIHKACGYVDTHNMDVSIQGRYDSMGSRIYRDHNFLNRIFDDRGILVKMLNEGMLSNAYLKVAESEKNNSSFQENKDIRVFDEKLFEEYQDLKKEEKSVSNFRTVISSIKRYEVLYDIDLVLHITSEDRKTMEDIYKHAYDITALGRSEDFVELKSVDWTTLSDFDEELDAEYSAFIAIENVRKKRVLTKDNGYSSIIIGTKYSIPKMYTINEKGQRIFDKRRVLYTSGYTACRSSEESGIFVDWLDDGSYYIVNLI